MKYEDLVQRVRREVLEYGGRISSDAIARDIIAEILQAIEEDSHKQQEWDISCLIPESP